VDGWKLLGALGCASLADKGAVWSKSSVQVDPGELRECASVEASFRTFALRRLLGATVSVSNYPLNLLARTFRAACLGRRHCTPNRCTLQCRQ